MLLDIAVHVLVSHLQCTGLQKTQQVNTLADAHDLHALQQTTAKAEYL